MGTIKWPTSPRSNGAQRMAVGISVLAPGPGHLRHNHPGLEETVYVLSGVGRQMLEDEAGQPTYREVVAGDVVHVPEVASTPARTGAGAAAAPGHLRPGGAEEVLRELPGCTIIPPASTPER